MAGNSVRFRRVGYSHPLAWLLGLEGAAAVVLVGVRAEPIALTFGDAIEARVALHDADLARLLRGFDAAPQFALIGRVSADLDIAVPLDAPTDRRRYRVQGAAEAVSVRVGAVELCRSQAQLTYRDGILSLHELCGQVGDARCTVRGAVRLSLVPLGELDAQPLGDALADEMRDIAA